MAAYSWKTASYIKADANAAGKMCEELSQTVGLTAENLLQANTAEDAPLHDAFEWDNEKAAHGYRLQQARHIIACLVKVPDGQKDSTQPVRAFFMLENSEYEPTNVILQHKDKHAALLQKAYVELAAFRRKYYELKELEPLFETIDSITEVRK